MNKIYIVICFLLISFSVSAQQFSQYNTGTTYESFENTSVRSFIPDSSREYSFNFLIPNFDANAFITGDIQGSLKNRLFAKSPSYASPYLKTGQGRFNRVNANVNTYALMLKAFTSLNGDVEMGLSYQIRGESRGSVSDETLLLFNGNAPKDFPAGAYDNIFNNNFQMQLYNQIGFSYRERINKQLAIGFKLSALLGIKYSQFNVDESHIVFDDVKDAATLAMRGKYYSSYVPGHFTSHDYLPTFRNPGASINLGTSYLTNDKINIQANIKDLGFIHWSSRSAVGNFDGVTTINGISTVHREDSIYNRTIELFRSSSGDPKSFTTKTNARAELSASKTYWLDYDNDIKYIPTLVGSKELWYTGFTAGLVNHVQYKNYTGTVTFTYNDLKMFNTGLQFMYKNPDIDFFIGTDRLINTGRLALATLGNQTQIDHTGSYTGMDLYAGFSLKFGAVVEHPMNSSYIPMGEKGFFGRLWNRIFKTDK